MGLQKPALRRPFFADERRVTKGGALLLSLMLTALPAAAQKYPRITAPIVPTPRPAAPVTQHRNRQSISVTRFLARLWPACRQCAATQKPFFRTQTGAAATRIRQGESDTLAAQAAGLRQKLSPRPRVLKVWERQKVEADAQIARLTAEDAALSAGFAMTGWR